MQLVASKFSNNLVRLITHLACLPVGRMFALIVRFHVFTSNLRDVLTKIDNIVVDICHGQLVPDTSKSLLHFSKFLVNANFDIYTKDLYKNCIK